MSIGGHRQQADITDSPIEETDKRIEAKRDDGIGVVWHGLWNGVEGIDEDSDCSGDGGGGSTHSRAVRGVA